MDRFPLISKPPFPHPESNFNKCAYAGGNCPVLSHGRMYSCFYPAYAHHIIDYFNLKNIQVSERDSINIYELSNPMELMEFYSRPIPFCRFCNVDNITKDIPWGLTKRDINEWVDL